METNRRRFSRIHFDALAELSIEGGACIVVKVLDLSLKGALVQAVDALPKLAHGTLATLAVDLGDEASDVLPEGSGILMKTLIAHVHEDIVGLRCVEIDLDSITNLRSIVKFNLGDEAILSRELEYLSHNK